MRWQLRRITAAAMVLMLLLVSLVGCGKSSDTKTGGTPAAETPVTLNYWSMWNKDEPQQLVLEQVIKKFETANPNIKINVQWGGRDVLTKVRAAMNTGDTPDLVDKDAEEVYGALILSGQALPLDDVLAMKPAGEAKAIGELLDKRFVDMFAHNGKPHLIPYIAITSGIWYNETQFKKLGVSEPKTWDELLTLVSSLKSKGVVPFAADGISANPNVYWYYYMVARHAGPGQLLKAAADKTGAAWDAPHFLNAAKDLEKLWKLNAFQPGYEGSQWPAAQSSWAQGNMAMLMMGSWAPTETSKYAAADFKYRMFPFPSVPNGKNTVEAFLLGWVIPKGAKNADAAKKFMAFALGKEQMQMIVDQGKNMTTRLDLPVPPELVDAQKLLFAPGVELHRVRDGLQAAQPAWYTTVFRPLVNQHFFGKITSDQFIKQLKEDSIKFWKTN